MSCGSVKFYTCKLYGNLAIKPFSNIPNAIFSYVANFSQENDFMNNSEARNDELFCHLTVQLKSLQCYSANKMAT